MTYTDKAKRDSSWQQFKCLGRHPATWSCVLSIVTLGIAGWGIPKLWGAASQEGTKVEVVQAVATLAGGVFVFWNIKVLQEGQITERFSRAVEQLGSDKVAVRLGAIYALERIAKDSPRDHWVIMEILSSFVQCQPYSPTGQVNQIPVDVLSALIVLGRRSPHYEDGYRWLDLSGANLKQAKLSHANFRNANLQGVNFREATLTEVDFSGANLERANFRGVQLERVQLQNANLQKILCTQTTPPFHKEGTYRIQHKAMLQQASLSAADLSDADLSESCLAKANLRRANLNQVNLYGADLSQASLMEANATGAILHQADLHGSNAERAIFSKANLVEANLSGIDLQGADLCQSDLTGAVLTFANLTQANCRQAILRRVNLKEATLEGADLWKADLREALYLDELQIKAAKNWETAIYDQDIAFRKELKPYASQLPGI